MSKAMKKYGLCRGILLCWRGHDVDFSYGDFFYFQVSFPAALMDSGMGIIIFSANMYCRSNQSAGFYYGIKYNFNNLCSDKHCYKSLQADCREERVDI